MLLGSYCTQALAARKRKLPETNETMDLRSVGALSLVQICTLPLWSDVYTTMPATATASVVLRVDCRSPRFA